MARQVGQADGGGNLDRAQYASFYNRNSIEGSQTAGCFHCQHIFPAYEVVNWLDEQYEQQASALCPHCGVCTVIGDAAGFPITEDFLAQMNQRWVREAHGRS